MPIRVKIESEKKIRSSKYKRLPNIFNFLITSVSILVFLSLFYMCKKNNQISIKRGLLSNIFWNQNVKVYNLVEIMYQKISIHFRTWITWISAKKKPKTRFAAAAEEECSFKAILNSFFMALGHILPDLILGNSVQKCISWILPIISNEPFMTQDE